MQLVMNDTAPAKNELRPTILPEPMRPVGGRGSTTYSAKELADRERKQAFDEAIEARRTAALEQSIEAIWADIVLKKAQWAVRNTQTYEEAGALLRANAQRLRQEQRCDVCGFLFNYLDGRLLPKHEWCDPRRKYCEAGIGNTFCLTLQETLEKAKKRKSAWIKAKKPRRTPTVSTNGHRPVLSARDEEER